MKKVKFEISYVDNLGQGVAKDEGITLILKTLPNEKGFASLTKRLKNIQFAKLEEITSPSKERKVPECVHFQDCMGCHYLHTNYEYEIDLKTEQLKHLLKNEMLTFNPVFQVIKAPQRLGYRNRIQLHYDQDTKEIGFKSGEDKIIPVPDCLIADKKVKEKLKSLYFEDSWLQLVRREKSKGHLEIYQKQNEVRISLNDSYASGGFSQVNQMMNEQLTDLVATHINHYAPDGAILDLFGGNGNLVQKLRRTTLSVDLYKSSSLDPNKFLSLDLFNKNALKSFIQQKKIQFDHIIIDPPRSGFKELEHWASALKIKSILYVSCNPQTQKRDIGPLLKQNFKLKEVALIDLFPSTFHIETCLFLRRE